MRLNGTDRIRRKSAGGLAEALGDLLQQELGEQQTIALPVAQRRHADGHFADAVEQIIAEAAGADQGLEIAIGGAHDAQVEHQRHAPADALHGALLHHAQ